MARGWLVALLAVPLLAGCGTGALAPPPPTPTAVPSLTDAIAALPPDQAAIGSAAIQAIGVATSVVGAADRIASTPTTGQQQSAIFNVDHQILFPALQRAALRSVMMDLSKPGACTAALTTADLQAAEDVIAALVRDPTSAPPERDWLNDSLIRASAASVEALAYGGPQPALPVPMRDIVRSVAPWQQIPCPIEVGALN